MKLPDSVRVTGDSGSAAAHGNHMSEKSLAFIGNVAAGGCQSEAVVWIAGHFR